MDKARYITSREDIMASLHLLEITILKEHRKEKQTAQQVYKTLKEFIQKDQELTARNIAEIIHYKKTQTHSEFKVQIHYLSKSHPQKPRDSNQPCSMESPLRNQHSLHQKFDFQHSYRR